MYIRIYITHSLSHTHTSTHQNIMYQHSLALSLSHTHTHTQERQVRQLLELVPQWVDVDSEDALEMLGVCIDMIRLGVVYQTRRD